MGKNLQAALERSSRGASPTPPVAVAANQSTPEPKKAGREGKVHIGAYLPADFKTSLLLVRAQTGKDVQGLVAQALNDLFKAHNVPVVDYT